MKSLKRRNQKGFSLVELMVVVAIIGILSSLAVPRFRTFQAKARQSEAKSNLKHIYTLQMSYYGEHEGFVSFGEIGGIGNCAEFDINPIGFTFQSEKACEQTRYTYSAEGSSEASVSGPNGIQLYLQFDAYAESGDGANNRIIPNCAPDVWIINDEEGKAYADNDVTTKC